MKTLIQESFKESKKLVRRKDKDRPLLLHWGIQYNTMRCVQGL